MKRKEERRRWPRERYPTLDVAIVYRQRDGRGPRTAFEGSFDTLLVLVVDYSKNGFLLKSTMKLKVGSLVHMRIRLPRDSVWVPFIGKVVRVADSPTDDNYYFVAVELDLGRQLESISMADKSLFGKGAMSPSDLAFFLGTKFFNAISEEAMCSVLNRMTPRDIRAGERFIRQGTRGKNLYIVQEGSCVVSVEKDGTEHPIARLRAGDVVGEIALLTGGARSAHVDAETDVTLWEITRRQFDELCSVYPDALDFLTELVTHRLSGETFTADRNIGKYVISEIIGRGGWGVVYKGIHRTLNMPVAIKMLKHDMAMDPDFSEKFRHEAKTIAHLNHENIVKVYDIEELYRTIFIIMEYLEGVPLDYLLEKMPKLPLPRVVDILSQVCAGLAYAHKQRIVHQDIKPANIFVQQNDRVKILDFGLACFPESSDNGLRGTIFYSSPEAIQGDFVDERTDVYSLGIMAFEMITGQKPFPEDDINKLIDLQLQEDAADPATLVPDLPDELRNFVMRATKKDPAERYGSIAEALRDLDQLAVKIEVRPEPHRVKQLKMMSLFLFYRDEQELALKRKVEKFDRELKKIGAGFRAAEFKDLWF